MGQQQSAETEPAAALPLKVDADAYRVSFSVGTKLLLSVVLLLMLVIGFLNISAIFLLRDDRKAYTYQSQSREGVLAGTEFANTVTRVLGTLRLTLAAIEPGKPVTPQQNQILQSLIANQSDVLWASIFYVNPQTGKLSTPAFQSSKEKELKEIELRVGDLGEPSEWIGSAMSELTMDAYAFRNVSRMGAVSSLAVFFADTRLKSSPEGMPVAVGLISLSRVFGNELRGMNLTIAAKNGRVLFDTDSARFLAQKTLIGDPLYEVSVARSLATGAYEYDLDGTHYLGSYFRPGLNISVFTRTEWIRANRATYALTEKFILLGVMAIGGAIVFAILFAKSLTAPLNRLYAATREVATGNFNVSLKSTSHDEIGALTRSFNWMSQKISELIEASMEKVRLENELAIASAVQNTLLPATVLDHEKIYVRSFYQSANQCGGDWWSIFHVGNKACVMIADATGHGLSSALITASARSCFSLIHKLALEDPKFNFTPTAMLQLANQVVYDTSQSKIMMTFFLGVIDFDSGKMTFSSAAHNPPWLFQKDDKGGFKMKSLMASGKRLGETREAEKYEEKTVDVRPGDILFLYTDGLIEGKSPTGGLYGKKRVREILELNVAGGPDQIVDTLIGDFFQFNNQKRLDDDVTIAVARIQDGHAQIQA